MLYLWHWLCWKVDRLHAWLLPRVQELRAIGFPMHYRLVGGPFDGKDLRLAGLFIGSSIVVPAPEPATAKVYGSDDEIEWGLPKQRQVVYTRLSSERTLTYTGVR